MKTGRSRRAQITGKKKARTGIVPKVIAGVLLLSFLAFTLGVVGYVIFFGGFQA